MYSLFVDRMELISIITPMRLSSADETQFWVSFDNKDMQTERNAKSFLSFSSEVEKWMGGHTLFPSKPVLLYISRRTDFHPLSLSYRTNILLRLREEFWCHIWHLDFIQAILEMRQSTFYRPRRFNSISDLIFSAFLKLCLYTWRPEILGRILGRNI